ncbi:MAG: gliding motility-associated-like protein, partial [Dokdonia sp.]
SLGDAETQNDPITTPTSFQNTSNTQTIFVRLTNTLATDCFDIVSFQLIVEDVPVIANELENLLVCDTQENDGLFTFNLTINESLAIGNQTGVSVTFHLTEEDASDGTNPILNPENFENTASPQIIYVRIAQDDDVLCDTIDSFSIEVFDQPVIPSLDDLVSCDDSSNDGVLLFDLTQQEDIVLSGQEDFMVSYHTTIEEAQNNIGTIQNPESYQNTTNPQTIYVRLENPVNTDCFDLGIFAIEALTIDPPQILPEIISCNEGFEMAIFDLVTASEAIVLLDNETITGYYESSEDAFNEENQITDPFSYTNSISPQTIFIRTDSPDSDACYMIALLNLEIENCPPFVPEGFSPNGDTINDTFEISGLKDVFDYELTIYSRLGNLIYKGDNTIPFWDGTPNEGFGGNEAPTGVYFWSLKLRDSNFDNRVGWVYLNR